MLKNPWYQGHVPARGNHSDSHLSENVAAAAATLPHAILRDTENLVWEEYPLRSVIRHECAMSACCPRDQR
ncbi:hypothetical protein, partial [Chloroflexus sp.]|uniref:hypothetical protein n=1 Tax=Chloroflexus sp. TaxID=1904827 RepID=UPI00404A7867